MKSRISISFLMFLSIGLAQINFSGSLVSNSGSSENSFNYSENRFSLNSDWNNWIGWLELEHSNPPELGRKNIGLRKIRIEYQGNNFALKLGDIYEYWGNGLIFNMIDDQSIDLDTGLKGALISYTNDFAIFEYIYGNQRSWRSTIHMPDFDERIPNFRTNYILNGVKTSFNLQNSSYDFYLLDVANNAIDFDINSTLNKSSIETSSLLSGFSLNYAYNNFELDYHFTGKVKHKGSAHNFNSYVFLNDFSFSLSLKDYYFDKLSPDNRWDFINNPNGVAFFQQMPTVFKTHSSLYLARATHRVDYNDELGFSFTVEKQNRSNGSFIFNYSQSSRHAEWENVADQNSPFVWSVKDRTTLPSSKWQYNPFQEIYFEVNGYHDSKLFYQMSYANSYDVLDIFSSKYLQSGHAYSYEALNAKTIPIIMSYELNSRNSINTQIEYQILKKGIYSINPNSANLNQSFGSSFSEKVQRNKFISIGFSRSPKWSISLNIDNTNTEDILIIEKKRSSNFIENLLHPYIDKSLTWSNVELIFNPYNSTQISLSYGSQRGGVLCSNGICRYVQSFENGLKFGITAAF